MNRTYWVVVFTLAWNVCQAQGVLSAVPENDGEPQRTDPFPKRCAFKDPASTLLHCRGGDVINVPVESASAICNMREQIVSYRNEHGKSWVLCIAREQLRTEQESP